MAFDGAQLEGERARVAVVEDDEVEHRRGLQLAEIARSVGDGAVTEPQCPPHRGPPVDRRAGKRPQRAGRHPPPPPPPAPAALRRYLDALPIAIIAALAGAGIAVPDAQPTGGAEIVGGIVAFALATWRRNLLLAMLVAVAVVALLRAVGF